MSLQNDFLVFGGGSGANVDTQSNYSGGSYRTGGFSAGTAQSNQANKAWRQSSIMAAMLAQFVVDYAGQTAIDDGTTSTLETNLALAIRRAAERVNVLTDTGTTNAMVANHPANMTPFSPAQAYIIHVHASFANTGATTLNVDGVGAYSVVGRGGYPLQGGEIYANEVATFMFSTDAGGAWQLLHCINGALQLGPASYLTVAPSGSDNSNLIPTTNWIRALLAASYQPLLGFTPVQQGGGAFQATNKVFLGWDGAGLRCQVDATDLGDLALQSWVSGNFTNLAEFATRLISNPGYLRLPWGAIFQWGAAAASSSGPVTVSFPLTFPTQCFNVWASTVNNSPQTCTIQATGGGSSFGNSNFQLVGSWLLSSGAPVRTAGDVRWLAIGN